MKPGPFPGYIEPLLAELADRTPERGNWVHEIKWDGYRLQLHKREGDVRCFTRRGYDWTERFPTLVSALWHLTAHQVVLDGEVVVLGEHGDTNFSALESYVSSSNPTGNLVFYAFDLLHLDGMDLRDVPLLQRKEVLATLLEGAPPALRFSEHIEGDGAEIFRNACRLGLEGVVSKRKTGRYRSGRNDAWMKATCRHRETFPIVGLAFKGAKFDGVYLGKKENGALVFAGKVEQGFSNEMVRRLKARADRLKLKEQPLAQKVRKPKAQWIKPELLAEVEFRSKTSSGLLRHPSYKGLREDLD